MQRYFLTLKRGHDYESWNFSNWKTVAETFNTLYYFEKAEEVYALNSRARVQFEKIAKELPLKLIISLSKVRSILLQSSNYLMMSSKIMLNGVFF